LVNDEVSTVSVLLGNGDGTFQSQLVFAVSKLPWFLTASDFNGDGNLDLAVARLLCDYLPCPPRGSFHPSALAQVPLVEQVCCSNAYLRTAAELDAFTGLRRGELIGLQWEDLDFENLVIHVRRSVVMMVQGAPKTEASAKDVPLDAALAESLLKLRLVGPYNRETDWVFASPTMKGEQPLWPETLWRRYGRPAVKAAKIQKRVGFHTFRHTYTTLLTQNSEEVKVVQELLRHANSRITLDLYAEAGAPNKRLAQSKLLRMVLNKGEAGLTGTMTRIANSSQVLERNWRGRRDSNPRPLP
jgi:hypothetical protein